jgi:hypothetical protein
MGETKTRARSERIVMIPVTLTVGLTVTLTELIV